MQQTTQNRVRLDDMPPQAFIAPSPQARKSDAVLAISQVLHDMEPGAEITIHRNDDDATTSLFTLRYHDLPGVNVSLKINGQTIVKSDVGAGPPYNRDLVAGDSQEGPRLRKRRYGWP